LIASEQKKEELEGEFYDGSELKRGFSKPDVLYLYENRIYIPKSLRLIVLDVYHGSPISGHPGIRRTCRKLRRIVNWPYLENDVRKYIRSCIVCGRSKVSKEKYQGLRNRHPMRANPGDIVGIDFWGPIKCGLEDILLLTMIDYSTRWAEVVSIESTGSEETTSKFITAWTQRFGAPKVLVSDNGSAFDAVMEEFQKKLGIEIKKAVPYHPEGNSFIETFHRFLRTSFIALETYPVSTEVKTALIMWGYRSLPHTSTGETPSYLLTGCDIQLPFEDHERSIQYVDNAERLQAIKAARQLQLQIWEARRQQYEEQMNRKRRPMILAENQLIMMRNHASNPPKLASKWSYPCRVETVDDGGRSGTVKSLYDGQHYRVHIEDIKFINPPQTTQQELQWEIELLKEARDRQITKLSRQEEALLRTESHFRSAFV